MMEPRTVERTPNMKTVFFLLLSLALLVGGIFLFGLAPTLPGWQALVFFCGILSVTLAIALPMNILPKLNP
jgi:hypothetical protein